MSARWVWLLVSLASGVAGSVESAWVQYDVNTLAVVGAFEQQSDMRLTPDTAPLEVPGVTMANIPWPIPSGCLTGKREWSLVSPPGELPLVLTPGLLFFSTTSPLLTGCRHVSNWAELRTMVRALLVGAIPDQEAVGGLNMHWTWYDLSCFDALQNAQCIAWLANLKTMNKLAPGRGQGVTASGNGATLVTDALNFKTAQCTATPGGPFC